MVSSGCCGSSQGKNGKSRGVCGSDGAGSRRCTDPEPEWVQSFAGQEDHFTCVERGRRSGMNTAFQGLSRDRFDAKLKVTWPAKNTGDNDPGNMACVSLIHSRIGPGQIRPFDLGRTDQT